VGQEEIDGRKAERDTVSLAPPDPKDRKKYAWTPTELSGDVWFDEETPVRLQAQVHGIAEGQGQTLEVTLLWSVSGIGQAPPIPDPATVPVAP